MDTSRGRMSVCSPARVSLAAPRVDALWQSVMQCGIDHMNTDWLLVHLTARVPVQNNKIITHNHLAENLEKCTYHKYY